MVAASCGPYVAAQLADVGFWRSGPAALAATHDARTGENPASLPPIVTVTRAVSFVTESSWSGTVPPGTVCGEVRTFAMVAPVQLTSVSSSAYDAAIRCAML